MVKKEGEVYKVEHRAYGSARAPRKYRVSPLLLSFLFLLLLLLFLLLLRRFKTRYSFCPLFFFFSLALYSSFLFFVLRMHMRLHLLINVLLCCLVVKRRWELGKEKGQTKGEEQWTEFVIKSQKWFLTAKFFLFFFSNYTWRFVAFVFFFFFAQKMKKEQREEAACNSIKDNDCILFLLG